jgi:hypothetical protein
MNLQIINTTPPGDFEEVSIHMQKWEDAFLNFVRQRKRIKYWLSTMPTIPENVQKELNEKRYRDLVLEQDKWQHFLVPLSNW